MRRLLTWVLGALAPCLAFPSPLTGVARGQGTFSLGFAGGPDKLSGFEGSALQATYDCTLEQTTVLGAQGWSIGVLCEGATMKSFTTAGTDVPRYHDGGFNVTEVVDPGRNGGRQGGVSAIVLSFTKPAVLPPASEEVPETNTYVIAKAGIEAVVSQEAGCPSLRYVDDLRGAGQPVFTNVTEGGETRRPVLLEKRIDCYPCAGCPVSCCSSPVSVGFSAEKISSPVPFEGIVTAEGDTLCLSKGGEVLICGSPVRSEEGHVYVNLISQFPDPAGGVQGWSLSIVKEGDMHLTSVTTQGTSVPRYFHGGFTKTEIVDPRKNGGKEGVVSGIVLSFTGDYRFPPVGTETLLDIGVRSQAPEEVEPVEGGVLRFQDGLRGAGQPVQNATTVKGDTVRACGFEPNPGEVKVLFQVCHPFFHFLRGNASDDRRVDIADPIWIINELYWQGPAAACRDAADANDDGIVDSADVVYLIDYLFRGGPPPSAPFPECGLDPEGEEQGLGCPSSQRGCW